MNMSDVKTVIGEHAVIRGQIEGEEDLHVSGRLEGTVSLSETLYVEPDGVIQADVTAKNVVLHGLLIGNINVTDSVHIGAGGRMVGDIRATVVVIEQGAALRGQVDMGEFDVEASARPAAPQKPVMTRSSMVPPRACGNRRSVEPRIAERSSQFAPAPEPGRQRSSLPASPIRTIPPSITPAPMPRPSITITPPNAMPKRPAAPAPKLRNIGRAKARKLSR